MVRNAIIIVFGALFVGAVVYGATTIGSNISTGGTLDVTGLSTFANATSTSATSTAYLYVGFDITEPVGWDFSGGDLIVSGDAFFNSKATSSVAFWVGAGGTSDWLDLTGGDLYVQNDAEFDGTFYFNRATGTSATSTSYFYLGADITEPAGWDFSGGDLLVVGDTYLNSKATSSVSLWVGAGGTGDNIDLTGGDLYVQNDAEFDGTFYFNRATGTSATTTSYFMVGDGAPAFDYAGGDLWVQNDFEVGGTASSTAMVVHGTATTTKLVIGGSQTANATTTIILGDETAESATCVKIRTTAGDWVYGYATSSSAVIGLQTLLWTGTSCE